MNTAGNTFQVGTIYTTGESRDYVWRFEVVKRTAKFITIRDILSGETKRVGVSVSPFDGIEYAMPLGSYSMAPSLDADRIFTGRAA